MTDGPTQENESIPNGRLDIPTLQTLAQRASTHPLVEDWAFDPSSLSPRILQIHLDASAFPSEVTVVRLDVRWFTTGDYSFHYIEEHHEGDGRFQCRWDQHPKTTAPRAHFHPPPNAGRAEASSLNPHHLEVLFTVLDWVSDRLVQLHNRGE